MYRIRLSCFHSPFLPLVLAGVLASSGALAVDPPPRTGLSPWVSARVSWAFRLAWQRLINLESCRALFEPFGKDGCDLLADSRIVAADRTPYGDACHQGVSMVTGVGEDTIGICGKGVGRMPVHDIAALLLHEVLHHAGMSERPYDQDGLFSEQITRLVKRACRL